MDNIADKNTLEVFVNKVIDDFGKVDFLINNAAPKACGIKSGNCEDFEYALKVGVTAPFYLAKLLLPYFYDGASIVNISSSRDRMSQPETESYTTLYIQYINAAFLADRLTNTDYCDSIDYGNSPRRDSCESKAF